MDLKYTFDVVRLCANKFPEKKIFYTKQGSSWKGISSSEFAEEVDSLSRLLLFEGVNKGECVATIFSYNSYEWNIIDMALAQIGAIHVPVYPTISDSDYHFILTQAEVRWVFITDQVLYNKLSQLRSELPLLSHIICTEKLPSIDNFWELLSNSPVARDEYQPRLDMLKKEIGPENVCTILYTSGTTGFPKGVMLSHRNLCTNIEAAANLQPLSEGDRVLSFLPLCHIYQRTAIYQFIVKGVEVYYAESLKALLSNMKEIRPEGITVVPRVLEKIVSGINARARSFGALKRIFMLRSVRLGYKYDLPRQKSRIVRWKYFLANKFVYSQIRALLGGRIKYVGCGGAPTDERILRLFWAAGIPVYEGYGLTESSPLVSLNSPEVGSVKIGTVGPPIPNVEIRFANDGEILVKGPNVMKGYFKNDELTAKALKDNWLYTGDLGEMVDNKFLKIIGRKKEMFKTSYGKYIVPQAIESRFLDSQIIDYLIVIGEGKHYAAAIVSPNFTFARKLLHRKSFESNQEIIECREIKSAIEKEIRQVNKQLGKTEQIKRHLIVEDQWTIESGELSATQKLKRNIILHKYSGQIRNMYREDIFDEI